MTTAETQTVYVWIPELAPNNTFSPHAPIYATKDTAPLDVTDQLGMNCFTYIANDAMHFSTEAECKAWCDGWNRAVQRSSSKLFFHPREHGFG